MASHAKNKKKADQLRKVATAPVYKWWTVASVWVVVAVVVGVIALFGAPRSIEENPSSKFLLVHYLGWALLNVILMYGLSYFAARQNLSRRPIKEIWSSPSNKNAINRMGLPVILTAVGFAVITAQGKVSESLYSGLLIAGTIFAIYRALTTAYMSHYFDYVASPRDLTEIEQDAAMTSKKMAIFKRSLVFLGFSYPRPRLSFPLVQTAIVVFAAPFLVSAISLWIAGDGSLNDMGTDTVMRIAATALPIISVVLWTFWHLYGGITRVLRIGEGRPMKSYGWDLQKEQRPSKDKRKIPKTIEQ